MLSCSHIAEAVLMSGSHLAVSLFLLLALLMNLVTPVNPNYVI